MATEKMSNSFLKLNLSAIKKSDHYVVKILDSASQVALYKFNAETQAWEKTEVEGALFVYSRSTSPTSAFFIMNRLNMTNMMEPITSKVEFKLQDPFLLYRNITKGIFGIWFYDSEECKRLATLFNTLSSQISTETNNVISSPPAAEIAQGGQETKEEEKVDIMQLFAKAQERYNNQKKPSSLGASSLPSTPSKKQETPSEHKEQHQKFLLENQHQKEQLQKLFKTEDSLPKKQRTYSFPTSLLSGQAVPLPKGSGLENGFSPGREGQSSRKKENFKKSLTLSDVKAPVSSELMPMLRTQDDSAIDGTKGGAQRKLFHSEQLEANNTNVLTWQSAAPLSVVAHAKESPQKPSQDQGAAAGTSLMSPLAFQPSGKVTVMTSPAQSKSDKVTIMTSPAPSKPQPAKLEIAPLTQEQLVQAMTYLLKNDSEFVAKIHEAYFKSLQDKLPT